MKKLLPFIYVLFVGINIFAQLPTSVKLNLSAAIVEVGKTRALVATVLPTNAANKNVLYSSENSSIATVNSAGIVTGIMPGTVSIIAASEADPFKQDKIWITVIPAKGNNVITIRARGIQGGEHINLLINGSPVGGGWTLTTNYQDYTAYVSGDGDINVQYNNDGSNRDARIDYILVNGEKRQAENMQYNTGAYLNGSCGGGKYSEWLHCNGVIGFGKISDNFGTNTIVIRARGAMGGENISLLIDNKTIGSWTLSTTSFQEITATVEGDGYIQVRFNNASLGGTHVAIIDWVKVNIQEPRQAENMKHNTASFGDDVCGGGKYTQVMDCNGDIGFGDISDYTGGSSGGGCDYNFSLSPFPSINKSYSHMHVIGRSQTLSNVTNFTINWSLPNKALWDMSYSTNNGYPSWYESLTDKILVQNLDTYSNLSISGSELDLLNGTFYFAMDGDNLVLANSKYTITYMLYFSNSATPPSCASLKSAKVLNIDESLLSVNNEFLSSVKLYPNPSTGNVSIELNDSESNASIKICDLTGKVIYVKTGITEKLIHISVIKKGVYIVSINSNGHEYNEKLIIL